LANAQCGVVVAPLDYDKPTGTKVQLAVSRVQHQSPDSEYQGVMLTNPGGPGAPGLNLATLGQFVPYNVGDRYDWIGFDPRGVGDSRPSLSCVANYFTGVRPPFVPARPSILAAWLTRSQFYAAVCGAKAPAHLAHMTTADSARDMDTIRTALGVDRISYYGLSYGTYLGQVYATMFPDRLHRMVLDSSIDPNRVGYQSNLDQAIPTERNINIWFGWLARYDGVYHLGTTGPAVRRLFYQQVRALRTSPVDGVLGPAEFEDAFYAAAFNQSVWPVLGSVLSSWVHDRQAGGVIAAYQAFDTPGNDNAYAVSNAITCTDSPWPRQWSTWAHDFWRTYRVAPFATWNIAWYGAPCLYWPVAARTPVHVNGDHISALLVHETLDAANPFQGSLAVRERFPESRLLAEPFGTTHAGTLFGNACVDGYIAFYLAAGALPPRSPGRNADATCAPTPLPVPAGADQVALNSTVRPALPRVTLRPTPRS
jgi:pimeloyl-ACP methyl ester carboxylesterase